jgi:hypothetical protein
MNQSYQLLRKLDHPNIIILCPIQLNKGDYYEKGTNFYNIYSFRDDHF